MSAIFWRTTFGMSTHVSVVISPATTTRPVVIRVSQATRPAVSSFRISSRIVSEIWSATLSGWPSVTDSEVKRNSRAAMAQKATRSYLIRKKKVSWTSLGRVDGTFVLVAPRERRRTPLQRRDSSRQVGDDEVLAHVRVVHAHRPVVE